MEAEVRSMSEGTIFSVEEFSVYDGPGIRTSVFFKGCPLRCTWCHNPEGQEFSPTIVRSPNGCIGCNTCLRTAIRRDGRLYFTGEGIKNCPMHLLRTCGETLTADALVTRLLKNERILKEEGGITFSGGEPLAQSEFLFDCLDRLSGRLHTAVQTCGFADEKTFARALEKADYFLYDIKLVDAAQHRKFTGASNEPILRNLGALAASGKEFVIRIPLIPTVTDTPENLTAAAELLVQNHISYVELLPYNKMAGGKYKMLLREYTPNFDTTVAPEPRTELFGAFGIEAKVL